MTSIVTRQLDGRLALVIEPIDNVASTAVTWLLPAGSASDPRDRYGCSTMLAELIFRGAGGMTSREHSDALDRLGLQRSSHVTTHHLMLSATMVGLKLDEAMPLLVQMVLEPNLSDDSVEPVRSLSLQSLDGLQDDPQHLAMLRLRERHLPCPFNRHAYGRRNVLESLTADELRSSWKRRARPRGSILAVAGAVDPDRVINQLRTLLAGWEGGEEEPKVTQPAVRGYQHFTQDTSQVHIGMAFDSPPEADEHAVLERVAIAVLSGSTSGRLFTEVRQKRSLCYSVGASYRANRDRGMVAMYAGTTPQRAQETLEVCCAEVERLREGAEEEEFARAVIGLKSHLIMQGESTPSRATAIAADTFRLGRARTLEEIASAIDAVTLADLNSYLSERDFGELTVVSIGPEPLEVGRLGSVRAGGEPVAFA